MFIVEIGIYYPSIRTAAPGCKSTKTRETRDKEHTPLLSRPNPSFRNPDDHLEWAFYWNKEFRIWEESKIAALVRPKLKRNKEDEFGKASIAIYGLHLAKKR